MINTDVRNMPGFRPQDFLPSDVASVYTFSKNKNVTEILREAVRMIKTCSSQFAVLSGDQ